MVKPYLLMAEFYLALAVLAALDSTFTLLTVGAGTILQWVSIFLGDYLRPMQGVAYALWVASLLPIVFELWNTVRTGLERSLATPSGTADTTRPAGK